MNSVVLGSIAFGFISAGILLGFFLNRILPVHHLSTESKDAIKMAWGIVATMAALVLSLLVASAKNTFDTVSNEATGAGAKVIVLDHLLATYGPETKTARELLRKGFTARIQTVWPGDAAAGPASDGLEHASGMEDMEQELNNLTPQTDAQRAILAQARQICIDMLMTRWLIIEQSHTGLPNILVVVLVSWLTLLFLGIGLLAPRNKTVLVALFLCNFSFSTAIFLINEMDRPLDGVMKISSTPLTKVLEHLGQP